MTTSEELFAEAKLLDERSTELKRLGCEARNNEMLAIPLSKRLVYAAYDRCPCGAGLAYDPCHEDKSSPFVGTLSGFWDCSAILLGSAEAKVKHTDKLPFAFWEVKSEKQPSVNGATTRPKTDHVA
jgi:hypothetical protein